MGFFSQLLGWDQSLGALNAVLASYLIENASDETNKDIAGEVVNMYMAAFPSAKLGPILLMFSGLSRVVQMNLIAIACDNLRVTPPVKNNVWTRIKNPFQLEGMIDNVRIEAAIDVLKKDGALVKWPGNSVRVDFESMYKNGKLRANF